MLRLSLSQVPRLLEIEANTNERLDEARRMRWLGELAALEEGLRHIANKKNKLNDSVRAKTREKPASAHWNESNCTTMQTARSVVRRRVFLTQGQEAFLEGHVYGFERLGGVPVDKIRYDNLNSAVKQVLFGRSRQEERALDCVSLALPVD